MKTLLIRTASGFVFVVILIGSMIISPFTYMGLMSILTFVGMFEFYKMLSTTDVKPQVEIGSLVGVLVYFLVSYVASGLIPLIFLSFTPLLLVLIFIVELFRNKKNPLMNIAVTLMPILYISVSFGITNYFRNESQFNSYHMLVAFFVMIWTFDSFAYLTGVSIGKHRMMERVSPKKSWEGFFGGLIFSMIAGYVIGLYFNDLTSIQWMIFAAIVGIFGTLGDLVESMMKRAAGIKDSGKIMPGHGGVLDRFDAVLILAPVIAAYLIFLNLL